MCVISPHYLICVALSGPGDWVRKQSPGPRWGKVIVIQSGDFSLVVTGESIMMRWPCATNCQEKASGIREARVRGIITLSLQAACSCDHQGGLMNYTSRARMGQALKNQLRKCTERPISGFTIQQPICWRQGSLQHSIIITLKYWKIIWGRAERSLLGFSSSATDIWKSSGAW